jgi:hypothetical protein
VNRHPIHPWNTRNGNSEAIRCFDQPISARFLPKSRDSDPHDPPLDSQNLSTDSKNTSTYSKNMSTDSPHLSTDSKNMSGDSKIPSPDSKRVSTDSNIVSPDSPNMSSDSRDMSTDSRKMSTDSRKMSRDSNLVSTDSDGLSADSRSLTRHSKRLNAQALLERWHLAAEVTSDCLRVPRRGRDPPPGQPASRQRSVANPRDHLVTSWADTSYLYPQHRCIRPSARR